MIFVGGAKFVCPGSFVPLRDNWVDRRCKIIVYNHDSSFLGNEGMVFFFFFFFGGLILITFCESKPHHDDDGKNPFSSDFHPLTNIVFDSILQSFKPPPLPTTFSSHPCSSEPVIVNLVDAQDHRVFAT